MKNNTITVEISLKTLLIVLLFPLILLLFWKLRSIFVIFFLAFIFNSALRPAIDKLESYRIPRSISITITYFALIIIFILALVTVIGQTIQQFSVLREQLPNIVSNIGQILSNFAAQLIDVVDNIPGFENLGSEDVKQRILDFFKEFELTNLGSVFGGGLSGALTIINSAINIMFTVVTVFILSIYMLARKENIYNGILTLLPEKKRSKYLLLIKRIEMSLGSWLRGQLFLMFVVGVMTWVGLKLPGLFIDNYNLDELALSLAVISGLLEAVPTFGPIITGFIGAVIAAGYNPDAPIGPVLYIILMFTVIQQLESSLVVPKIMQKAVGLDPIVTILAVLAAFALFGPIGAVLIIPLLAIVQMIIQFELNYDEKTGTLKNGV